MPFPHSPHPEPGSKFKFDANEEISGPPEFKADRATTYHDGKEAYIKLGRLAVIKECRGKRLAQQLACKALDWAIENPKYFNPSIKRHGIKQLGIETLDDIPRWKGLVCVHAQKEVQKMWASK